MQDPIDAPMGETTNNNSKDASMGDTTNNNSEDKNTSTTVSETTDDDLLQGRISGSIIVTKMELHRALTKCCTEGFYYSISDRGVAKVIEIHAELPANATVDCAWFSRYTSSSK